MAVLRAQKPPLRMVLVTAVHVVLFVVRVKLCIKLVEDRGREVVDDLYLASLNERLNDWLVGIVEVSRCRSGGVHGGDLLWSEIGSRVVSFSMTDTSRIGQVSGRSRTMYIRLWW